MSKMTRWMILMPEEWPEGAYEDQDAAGLFEEPDLSDNGEDE